MGEWKRRSIGELCDVGDLELQTGPFGSQLHASDYMEDGIPVVPTEAIHFRRIDHSVLPKISLAKAEQLHRHRLKPGDILFARRGVQATGHIGVVREAEEGFVCGTGAIRLRVNGDERTILPDFLSHVLADPASVEWFKFHAIGATMPNLNEGIIRAFPLTVPPLPEQRRIAEILSVLDDKIELNRQMNETLEALARALFKSWFVDFDPVMAKAEGRDTRLPSALADLFPSSLVASELGEIPKGWPARPLGEILTESFERVGFANVPEYSSTNNGLEPRSEHFLKTLAASAANNKVIRRGNLVFGLSRRVLNFGLMREEIGSVSGAYKVFLVDEASVRADVLERLMRLRSDYYYNALSASSREGQSVSSVGLGFLRFAQPSTALQDAFLRISARINARIRALDEQTVTLAELRDTMLPALVSGQLRVPQTARMVEAASA